MAMKDVLLVAWLVLAIVKVSRGFTYDDLASLNATCPGKDSCPTEKGPRLLQGLSWKERNCFCDEQCAEYGDCCLDSPSYDAQQQRDMKQNFECVKLKHFGEHYMQGRCRAGWEDLEVALMCSSGSPDAFSDRRDPLVDIPVTSLDSSVTYTNFYCAVCNDDSANLQIWKPRLECPSLSSYNARFKNLTQSYVESRLHFNDVSWGLYVNDGVVDVFHPCSVDPFMPETVTHLVRKCKKVVKTCADNWAGDEEVAELCASYTAVVYDHGTAYRNPHCAQCNYVPQQRTTCHDTTDIVRFYSLEDFHPQSFALLFDFADRGGSNVVGSRSSCGLGEVFDPFFRKCRNVICGKAGQAYRNGRCVSDGSTTEAPRTRLTEETSSTSTTTTTTEEPVEEVTTVDDLAREEEEELIKEIEEAEKNRNLIPEVPTVPVVVDEGDVTEKSDAPAGGQLTCERFLLPEEEFTMGPNGTVVVDKYQRTYQAHEYERREGGIVVCIFHPEDNKFSRLMGWVTLAGLGASCVCLVVHLGATCVVPELRNLSGKNLASLCVALLCAYVTFVMSVFGEPMKRECFVIAACMYYFFLATFTWMSVLAFDVWRTLRMATHELRVSNGAQWGKFIAYSVYGWLMPGAALAAILALDIIRPPGLPESMYPALGERWCWFGQRKALLVFFASPLASIMTMNIVFFIDSARIIAKTSHSTSKMTTCGPQQENFKLYMRLALLMGLTWISGIVAGYLQLEALWYVFVLLNTLQGVFVFLAFTCTRKVWRSLSSGCWRRVVLWRRGVAFVGRSPSSSRQGLESRDSNESHLSQASHSSCTHLTNSRTSQDF